MKNNYQLTKNAFGAICFTIAAGAIFSNSLIIGIILLCGYALVLEKDQWMSKQALQALFISLFSILIIQIISLFNLNITIGFSSFNILIIILTVLKITLCVFSLIGIIRTSKGLDADLPFFTVLANKALGIATPKETPKENYSAPKETTFTTEANNFTTEENKDEDTWVCSCGRINKGNFCSICGNKRN